MGLRCLALLAIIIGVEKKLGAPRTSVLVFGSTSGTYFWQNAPIPGPFPVLGAALRQRWVMWKP